MHLVFINSKQLFFRQREYSFPYVGEHYILYDDFKDIRVTVGFQKCDANSTSSCNCAVYLKSARKLVFMDFCDSSTTDLTPTSAFYGISVDSNSIGLRAIHLMPKCQIILPHLENNESTWENIPSFLGTFKCARVQGSNNYETLIVRNFPFPFRMNKND